LPISEVKIGFFLLKRTCIFLETCDCMNFHTMFGHLEIF
jgi:hypothetical protein